MFIQSFLCSSEEGDPATAGKFYAKADEVLLRTLEAFAQDALGSETMGNEVYQELLLNTDVTDALNALLICDGDEDKSSWISQHHKLLTSLGDAR